MIYITGATGHIGNNLVKKLVKENIDFRILSRNIQRSIEDFTDKIIIGDVFSFDFLNKHLKTNDTLVHLAAYINLNNDKHDFTDKINYEGTKMIADFCSKNNIYLIYTSSTDAIPSNQYLVTEPKTINHDSLKTYYQKSKAQATNYLLELQKTGMLKTLIIYPSAVIGINDFKPSAFAKEIKRCFKRRVCFYFHGGYNFIDVLDVCDAIISGMKNQISDSFIVSNTYVSLFDMYRLIFKSLRRQVIMIKVPMCLVNFVGLMIPKLKVMIAALMSKHNFDNQKMRDLLSISPRDVSETIDNTIKWLKKDIKHGKSS